MARAFVTRGLGGNSAFVRALVEAGRAAAERELQEVARAAEQRADAIVSREFNNTRPGDRRRPGRHLLGSFKAEVVPGSGNQIGVVRLTSSAPAVKVNSLNYGSSAHDIGADGRKLAFREQAFIAGSGYRNSAAQAKRRKGQEGRSHVVTGPVHHPGTIGSFFLERALEQAVQERLRRAVRLPRA